MTYYEDLSAYTYHGSAHYRHRTKNVGWLGLGCDFAKEEPTAELLNRLWAFCKVSVAQMRGLHQCEFCPNQETNYITRNGEPLLLGSSEMRVFSRDGEIYAAPTLIYHYVEVHKYRPPDEFVRALEGGPCPPSQEYFDRLKELNLEWNWTSAPAARPVPFGFGFRPDSSERW